MPAPENRTPPTGSQLSRMLSIQPESLGLWDESELADLLRHQLDAPLLFDLGRLGQGLKAERSPGGIGSFRELLRHPDPPIDLLVLTKEFGKSGAAHPDSPVPAEVGTALYYGAIAAALVRLHRRITTMGDADLMKGLQWGLQQSWVDPEMHRLFSMGEQAIGADPHIGPV